MRCLLRLLMVVSLCVSWAGRCPAAGLTRMKTVIQNPTSSLIRYTYKMGGDDWQKKTLKSGYTQTTNGIAPHIIRFDNGKKRSTQYTLMNGRTYYFQWSNGKLDLLHR